MRKREITRDGAVLVRPDRFIGFRSRGAVADPLAVLTNAFRQILAADELMVSSRLLRQHMDA
jgi:2,4-dichlorophenol 6-monooxygenase